MFHSTMRSGPSKGLKYSSTHRAHSGGARAWFGGACRCAGPRLGSTSDHRRHSCVHAQRSLGLGDDVAATPGRAPGESILAEAAACPFSHALLRPLLLELLLACVLKMAVRQNNPSNRLQCQADQCKGSHSKNHVRPRPSTPTRTKLSQRGFFPGLGGWDKNFFALRRIP